jgi:hypothetical protein
MSNIKNDEALAYGFMMLCLYFGVGVMIWLCWAYAFNIILTVAVNPQIAAGTMSMQTVNATAWNVNVLRYAPPIILLFGFIYGTNRAIFKRGGPS